MTRSEAITALGAAREAGDTAEVTRLESLIAQLSEAAAEIDTAPPANAPVAYSSRTLKGSVIAKVKDLDVRNFMSKNGKPKVAQLNLKEPVFVEGYLDDKGYPKPITAIFLSKKQADTICRVAGVTNLRSLQRFIALSQGRTKLELDLLVDEQGVENVLPSNVLLSDKIVDVLINIEAEVYKRSMVAVEDDAFGDEPME